MTVRYHISKFANEKIAKKEGELHMEAVPRKGDTVYLKGFSLEVTGKASWYAVDGYYFPLIFLS